MKVRIDSGSEMVRRVILRFMVVEVFRSRKLGTNWCLSEEMLISKGR
jgi:hypothetical protein